MAPLLDSSMSRKEQMGNKKTLQVFVKAARPCHLPADSTSQLLVRQPCFPYRHAGPLELEKVEW
eukprot:12904059-Prorocentrum_lima.AAC.1